MLSITVRDVFSEEWELFYGQDEPHCIYCIRDENTVFYIGRSCDPLDRLLCHFGGTWRSSGTSIALFYQEYKAYAQDWTIDLYTLSDCKLYVMQYFPLPEGQYEKPEFYEAMVARAEVALMRHFHPCLNRSNNVDPSPLPAKYNGPTKPKKSIFAGKHKQ